VPLARLAAAQAALKESGVEALAKVEKRAETSRNGGRDGQTDKTKLAVSNDASAVWAAASSPGARPRSSTPCR
jgi:hypothetical protein